MCACRYIVNSPNRLGSNMDELHIDNFTGETSSQFSKEAYLPVSKYKKFPRYVMGNNTSSVFLSDPKLLGNTISKYKFAGKMLENKAKVLEVGCMEGFGSIVLEKFVKSLYAIDFYKPHLKEIECSNYKSQVTFGSADFLDRNILFGGNFNGIVSFDVLEHIDPNQENYFFESMLINLHKAGICIVGMPSVESQIYAQKANKRAHINCKSGVDFRQLCEKFFSNVFLFSMNDEVVHTGFSKMAHYLICICVNPKP